MLIDGFCVVHVISCLFALEQGSSGEDVCRPSHFYIKYLEGYNGRYWFRTSDLFDEVGDRRGIPLGNPFPISSSRHTEADLLAVVAIV